MNNRIVEHKANMRDFVRFVATMKHAMKRIAMYV